MKPTRGQKLCSKCNTINGVRSYTCKNCGNDFPMKKPKKGPVKEEVSDFKSLRPGQTVRVVGGSGPYYIDALGQKRYFTDRGKYLIMDILPNGLIVSGKSGGEEFLYMGEYKESPVVQGVFRQPHKLFLLKSTERIW